MLDAGSRRLADRYGNEEYDMFQPCPGIVSCTISASSGAGSDIFQNILHFRKPTLDAWGGGELQTLLDGVHTWLGSSHGEDAIMGHLAPAVTVEKIDLRDLTVANGLEKSLNVDYPGVAGGSPLNSGLSFALTLRTGQAGRSQRGRLFMYGLTTEMNDGPDQDRVSPGSANLAVAGWAALITEVASLSPTMEWVVLSRRHTVGGVSNVLRDNGVGTKILSVGYSNLVIDFQRRRAPLHARHN